MASIDEFNKGGNQNITAAVLEKILVDKDLEELELTIDEAVVKTFEDEKVLSLVFKDSENCFNLGTKTNLDRLGIMLGDDYECWGGKKITLFVDQTQYQNKPVACVRIKMKRKNKRTSAMSKAAEGLADQQAQLEDLQAKINKTKSGDEDPIPF